MKFTKIAAMSIAAAAGLLAGSAFAQVVKSTGGLMTDAQGMTLYVFTKDAANKSNCSGACLNAWPAFVPRAEARPFGELGIILRDEGLRQWTHKQRPLYYFVGDDKAGDKEGDKQNGVWFVVPFDAEVAASETPAVPVRYTRDIGY